MEPKFNGRRPDDELLVLTKPEAVIASTMRSDGRLRHLRIMPGQALHS